jgi:hypothetical protein
MYLIYDCSPVSRPLSYNASFTDVQSWPRLVHISWIVLGIDYKPVEDYDCVVIPEGFEIDEKILKFCKLDEEDVKKKATELEDILDQFNSSAEKCEYAIAHNIKYNENILAAEYMRKVKNISMFKLERICLMQESTYFCKLPSKTGGFKWPSLEELHASCFHTKYASANNARADVIAAARSFIKLMKGGHLEDVFED